MEENGKSVLFGTWLRTARATEREAGVKHRELACCASKLTPYIQDHMAHALQSMEELYVHLPSAATSEEKQRTHWEEGREDFIARMRAALDHIGAVLSAVGCTDEELGRAGQANETEKESNTPAEPGESDEGDEGNAATMQIKVSDLPQTDVKKSEK